jgi:hypothetical protein
VRTELVEATMARFAAAALAGGEDAVLLFGGRGAEMPGVDLDPHASLRARSAA